MRKLVLALIMTLGFQNVSADSQPNLPWQSMPEIFNKKSSKEIARQKSKEIWQEQQIEQLRDDNRELMARLQESLMLREELHAKEEALLVNLELESINSEELKDTLRALTDQIEQGKEKSRIHEEQFKAELQKQKRETQLLAEALVASRKELTEFKHKSQMAALVQKKTLPAKEMIALEDLDLNEMEKAAKNIENTESGKNVEEFDFITSISECEALNNEIAFIDESEVMIGVESNENPSEMVFVSYVSDERPGFYISPHKVTNQEYERFVKGINYKRPTHWEKGHIPEDMENQPVVNVSYQDAFLYSVWLGKRLPSEDELLRTTEIGDILADVNEDLSEWTATPEMRKSTHRIFSGSCVKQDRYLPNHTYNGNTGFRVASDSN